MRRLLLWLACVAWTPSLWAQGASPWAHWIHEGEEAPERVLARLDSAPRAPAGSTEQDWQRAWVRTRGIVAARGHQEAAADAAIAQLRAWAAEGQPLAAADAQLVEALRAERQGLLVAADLAAAPAEQAYARVCAEPAQPTCDPWVWWRLLRLRGNQAETRGQWIEARAWHTRAAAIAGRAGDELLQSWSVGSLAVVAQVLGEGDEARQQMARAEALAARDERPETALRLQLNQARLAERRGDAAGALRVLEGAWQHGRAQEQPRLQALLLGNLGDLLRRGGRSREALAAVEQALPVVRHFDDRRLLPSLLFNGGLARMALGQTRAGRADLVAALAVWEQGGAYGPLREALRQGADALAAIGEHREALEWLHRETALAERLDEANRAAALAELHQHQDRQAEQQEMARLARENELASARLASQQWVRRGQWLVGGLLLATAALLAGLVLRLRAGNRRLRHQTTRLLRLSERDPLTGLPNRRHFQEGLKRLHDPDGGFSGALLMIDVDHFKRLNDQQGHAAGDRVLAETARRLRACLRETDLVCRWGGEEFLVASPGLRDEALLAMVRRALRVLADTPVTLPNGQTVAVTVSIGFAAFPLEGEPAPVAWDTALARADLALYAAKAAGRDGAVGVTLVQAGSAAERELLLADFGQARERGLVRLVALRRDQPD